MTTLTACSPLPDLAVQARVRTVTKTSPKIATSPRTATEHIGIPPPGGQSLRSSATSAHAPLGGLGPTRLNGAPNRDQIESAPLPVRTDDRVIASGSLRVMEGAPLGPNSPTFHPLFSYFGPRNPSWGRILVIGQEPDANQQMSKEAGPYDLPRGGRTTFWTWSHKAIERAAGFGGLALFHAARAVGSSPIAYSDASPHGYEVGPNPTDRRWPTDDELREHARSLLALPEARTCPVVVISGRKDYWRPFYDLAVLGFEARGAVVVQVPFFGRTRQSNQLSLVDCALKGTHLYA
jgi:hypothetical protein